MLVVTGAGGHVLDEVRLVDGKLAYRTGRAQSMVEAPRPMHPTWSDRQLYELVAGSSNGYVTFTESDG